MGSHIVPPVEELFSDDYAKHPDKSDKWWRNIFENPTTVQFDHRVLVRFKLEAAKLMTFEACFRPPPPISELPYYTHERTALPCGQRYRL